MRCEHVCGAVTNVVVGDTHDVGKAHGEQRLSPFQCLDLTLLIDAEHHRLVGWGEVETLDFPDFPTKNGLVEIFRCFCRWACIEKICSLQ